MKIRIVAVLSLLVSLNCHADIQAFLVGVWGSSEDEGKTFTSFDEYTNKGQILSWGYLTDISRYFELEANYKIMGNSPYYSCVEITYSSEPSLVPVGVKWCDEIVYIDAERFIYKSDDGRYNTLYRVSEFNPAPEFRDKL